MIGLLTDKVTNTNQQMYAIGEVARLTGVPTKTIRYYADIGLLPPAKTTEARYRLFTVNEIWRLEVIRTLRSFGFALDDIQQLLSGDLSVAQAIDVQLAAVDEQIEQLTRVQNVLRQAKSSADDPSVSLKHLHELGSALSEDVTKRRQLLVEKLRATLHPTRTTEQEQFLQNIAQQLPSDMSVEQAAAWGELVALISRPTFIAAIRNQVAPFVAVQDQNDQERIDWAGRMNDITQQALAAYEAQAQPDSDKVQTLVQDWLDLFATGLRRPNNNEFVQWFAENATLLMPPEVEQFWQLMGRVHGKEQLPPHFAAQRLLMDGVQWRAAQQDREFV